MARLVAGVGNVSYNGITFPTALHSRMQVRPAYQHGEVARKYNHCTLTIDTVLTYTDPPLSAAVTANQDMGLNMVNYRKFLTEPRKTLTFGEQGFGNFVVNNNGGAVPAGYRSVKDVAFGPKPRFLTWEPIGSNRAAHVTWVCETYIPECLSNSVKDEKVLLEVTQESTFTVNHKGLLTRTTKATLEIAANAIRGSFTDTVDSYTTRFQPPTIPGFHRETHRQISRDHRTLHITYTDTEIESDNPYAPGMVEMDVSHSASSTFMDDGFVRWLNTISGSIRWAKGVPGTLAWAAFVDIVRTRFQRNVQPAPIWNNNKDKKEIQRVNIPHSIHVTENIFDRSASFTISWLSTVDAENLFEATGLFSPVTNVSWGKWHASLIDAQSPFGSSGIKETITDIKIVDVCGNQNALSPKKTPEPSTAPPLYEPWFNVDCSSIKPHQSWIDTGSPMVRVITETGVVVESPAYGPSNGTVTAPDPKQTASTTGFDPSKLTLLATSLTNETSYQNRHYNTYMLEVTGSYSRICYEPYAPIFKSYGDVPLVLRDNDFTVKKVNGQFFPIYTLTYKQTYYLSRLPVGNTLTLLRTDVGNGDR